MNRLVYISSLIIALLILAGCASSVQYLAPVKPPTGGLLWSYKAPLSTDMNRTDSDMEMIKVSSKKTYYFHDMIFTGIDLAWGSADIPNIARYGGIKEVCYADYEILNILGIYAEFTVNVYGH